MNMAGIPEHLDQSDLPIAQFCHYHTMAETGPANHMGRFGRNMAPIRRPNKKYHAFLRLEEHTLPWASATTEPEPAPKRTKAPA
jgi:hypothetical protein